MTYKEVCEKEISTIKAIIEKLCDIRDLCQEKSPEQKYYQCLIDANVAIKKQLAENFQKAQLTELSK